MPLIQFKCIDCQTVDTRISALFVSTALCHHCGGLMSRLDPDPGAAFFIDLKPDCPWCVGPTPAGQPPISHRICPRHARELREG